MSQSPTPPLAGEVSPILLVDDDPMNLDVLCQVLRGPTYRLFVTRTGEEAINVARRARPLVILLDVVMPGIDGYETCRRLKDDPETRDAAVIFLSALTDPKDKVRGFEAGAVDFITKPFGGEEVIARVNTHIAIQRLLRRQAEAQSPAATRDTYDDARTRAPAVAGDTSAESAFRTGDVVAFRFRIVRYLAKGGMGELYEAEDLELRERVALKTILPTIADSERSIALFKREVHLARQVTHPNVCRIYDVFRHRPLGADGSVREVVFLAMELLRGETLADRLLREGRFQTTDILPIVRQMAEGLAAAHRVGVVHRDFKSPNVMLVEPNAPDQEMRVVVTDFGLARRSAQGEATAFTLSFADAGEISGTPAYMAPEQVEGGDVTPATDVYALGVVLYELATGVQPFVADSADSDGHQAAARTAPASDGPCARPGSALGGGDSPLSRTPACGSLQQRPRRRHVTRSRQCRGGSGQTPAVAPMACQPRIESRRIESDWRTAGRDRAGRGARLAHAGHRRMPQSTRSRCSRSSTSGPTRTPSISAMV